MKIKTDFVTNSSSSSFVVMGAQVDPSKISDERFKFYQLKVNESIDREDFESDLPEFIDDLIVGTDLQYTFGYDYYSGELQVGICYTKMDDNETLGQFKDRVRKSIMDSFGVDVDVGHIEDCWMDG